MISTRVMPPLDCANDVEGQCAPRPSGDAHTCHGGSPYAAASCGSPPRPVVAGRAERTGTGATPPLDAPVVACARVCLRTPRPRRGRSRPWIPAGRLAARCGSGPIILLGAPAGTVLGNALAVPFPGPGSILALDFMACHDPAFHAATAIWHYAAPSIATLPTGSVVLSVWRVWLRPRRGSGHRGKPPS